MENIIIETKENENIIVETLENENSIVETKENENIIVETNEIETLNCFHEELKKKYIISEKTLEYIIIKNLQSDERKIIFKQIETNYQNLYKKSINSTNIKNMRKSIKDVIISIIPFESERTIDKVFLENIMNINIDIDLTDENLNYLSQLYPNIKEDYKNFSIFIKDIFNNDAHKYEIHTSTKIIDPIVECLKKYGKHFKDISIKNPNLSISKHSIYSRNNINKETFYIRLDIVQANWTVFNKDLIDNNNIEWIEFININNIKCWNDFINYFNTDKYEFITKSKLLRQKIFGWAKLASKIMLYQHIMIDDVLKSIGYKHKFIFNDEIIYEMLETKNDISIYDSENQVHSICDSINQVHSIYDSINHIQSILDSKYLSLFRIELFKLDYYNLNKNGLFNDDIYIEFHYEINKELNANKYTVINKKLKSFPKINIIKVIKRAYELGLF